MFPTKDIYRLGKYDSFYTMELNSKLFHLIELQSIEFHSITPFLSIQLLNELL